MLRNEDTGALIAPDLAGLENRMAHLFRAAARSWGFDAGEGEQAVEAWTPYADVVEDAEYYRVAVELPGIDSDRVRLTIEDNVLAIRGDKPFDAYDEGRVIHSERAVGAFERYFVLPNTVDVDSINASFDNGVLTVSLTKAEAARTREIPIAAG